MISVATKSVSCFLERYSGNLPANTCWISIGSFQRHRDPSGRRLRHFGQRFSREPPVREGPNILADARPLEAAMY
jgi:hypothetical protein